MESEYDYPPLAAVNGDRNLTKITVTHDLGDRTLVVVILLAIIIGACGLVMGMNLAKQDRISNENREIAAKLQVQNNQNARIEAQLQEMQNAHGRK